MAENEKAKEGPAGPVGIVRIGDLDITITPLTLAEERALRRQLRAGAEAAAGDYFTRCAKLLKAMRADPAAYAEAVREIVRLTATGPTVSSAQLAEYGESPDGIATELFARGKKATAGLDLKGLKAIVTVANVDDATDQLERVLAGDAQAPKSTPGTPPG